MERPCLNLCVIVQVTDYQELEEVQDRAQAGKACAFAASLARLDFFQSCSIVDA
jgi:hypothetical protein